MKRRIILLLLVFSLSTVTNTVAHAQFEESSSHVSSNEEIIAYEETERSEEIIPYSVERIANSNLPKGQERVLQKGQNGLRSIVSTYIVKGNSRNLKEQNVSETQAVKEIIEYGTAELVETTVTSVEVETTKESKETTGETKDSETTDDKIGGGTKEPSDSSEEKKDKTPKRKDKDSHSKKKQRKKIKNSKHKFSKDKSSEKDKEDDKDEAEEDEELLPQTSEKLSPFFTFGLLSVTLGFILLKRK